MQDRERREGGILLLVQPELSKCCSLQRLGMRSDRVWEGLGVPGSDRSPSSGSSPACRHRSLPPAARALRVIKNEIRIEVLHTHTHTRAVEQDHQQNRCCWKELRSCCSAGAAVTRSCSPEGHPGRARQGRQLHTLK